MNKALSQVPEPYRSRVAHLLERLKRKKLTGLLVTQPENRRYLSGFRPGDPQLNESSGFLILGKGLALIGTDPRFEEEAARQAKGYTPFIYRKGLEKSWPEIQRSIRPIKRLGFEAQALSFSAYRRFLKLIRSLGNAFVPTDQVVEEMRAVKDPSEIKAIVRSLSITEKAFQTVLRRLRPGKTEREVAWALRDLIRKLGGEDIAFEPIVASGPNAALPHAEPTEREIRQGEPILFDFGSKWKGYCSDLSRTVVLGKPSDRFKEVYALVRQAQVTAEKGLKAGMSAAEADGLARSVIEKGGYGKTFKHSLGHGVGLATHELPSLSPVKHEPLQKGMVVTVEPGIYLPGWGGVRLEDMVLILEKKAKVLNSDDSFYRFG